MSPALVVHERDELAEILRPERRAERVIGLVPTMGALHRGHLSLIEAARSGSEVVVVSVFVNPTQFGDATDFDAYPRDLARDVDLASESGADIVFAPMATEIYPEGDPEVTVDPGPLGELLEGASRPGHFRGVATVVTKLLATVAPSGAYFGEKDFQQLLLVRKVVRDLALPVRIHGCPTVREPDGLALSSRNVRLSPEERAAAPALHEALLAGRAALLRGADPAAAEAAMDERLASEPLVRPDYATVRDATTLGTPGSDPLRLLLAARLGPVRLIDNLSAMESHRQ
jgi:pantoate--beta-alanine ligase